MADDDIDIYDDLDDFNLEQDNKRVSIDGDGLGLQSLKLLLSLVYPQQQEHNSEINEQLNQARQRITALEEENRKIQNSLKIVERNYSQLLKTAKSELQRKLNEITALRKE